MITENDLADALRQLHLSTHPERQPNEFTILEYAKANNLTIKQAGSALEYLKQVGAVEKPPKRYIDLHMVVVYKIVSPSKSVE
jgi:predicted nuclease of predicted toxin-antitoxin system